MRVQWIVAIHRCARCPNGFPALISQPRINTGQRDCAGILIPHWGRIKDRDHPWPRALCLGKAMIPIKNRFGRSGLKNRVVRGIFLCRSPIAKVPQLSRIVGFCRAASRATQPALRRGPARLGQVRNCGSSQVSCSVRSRIEGEVPDRNGDLRRACRDRPEPAPMLFTATEGAPIAARFIHCLPFHPCRAKSRSRGPHNRPSGQFCRSRSSPGPCVMHSDR